MNYSVQGYFNKICTIISMMHKIHNGGCIILVEKPKGLDTWWYDIQEMNHYIWRTLYCRAANNVTKRLYSTEKIYVGCYIFLICVFDMREVK